MWMSNVSIGCMGMPMTRMAVSSILLMHMLMSTAVAMLVLVAVTVTATLSVSVSVDMSFYHQFNLWLKLCMMMVNRDFTSSEPCLKVFH